MLAESIEVKLLLNRIRESKDINVVAEAVENLCKLAEMSEKSVSAYILENVHKLK